jgi:hypothetical protein
MCTATAAGGKVLVPDLKSLWRNTCLGRNHRLLCACLAFAASFYLVVNVGGHAWNALAGPGALISNRPAIRGPAAGFTTTAESWGAAVISVPFNARVGDYLHKFELPLWNPYQALGQPFAAQGDGSPYSPLAVFRSLLSEAAHNSFAVSLIILSSIFFYSFCHRVELSPAACRFATTCWILSPAVSWHIARHNYLDQIVLFPILFWAVAYASTPAARFPWLITTLVIALFYMGGFVQQVIPALITAYLLGLFLLLSRNSDHQSRLIVPGLRLTACFILGAAIASPYLMPIQEILQFGYAKNWLNYSLGFNPKGLHSFLFPNLAGPPFGKSIFQGEEIWGDTFAGVGFVLLVLVVSGLCTKNWPNAKQRSLFILIVAAICILLLRWLNIPPFSLLNSLPIIGLQTPKHIHPFTVFLCLFAAGLAVNNIDFSNWRRLAAVVAALFGIMAAIIGDNLIKNYYGAILSNLVLDHSIRAYLVFVLLVAVGLLGLVVFSQADGNREKTIDVVTIIAAGELSFYFLLGIEDRFFYWKLLVSIMVLAGAGFLFWGMHRAFALTILLALVVHAGLTILPKQGLPQITVSWPQPQFLGALQEQEKINYRTFGIFPDFSSALNIQDVSVVSAFTTLEFNAFVKVVGHKSEHVLLAFANSLFMLAGRTNFPLELYLHSKPIFDWFGIRFLVFDKAYFGPNVPDSHRLVADRHRFSARFEDSYSLVVESRDARPRVSFSTRYKVARSRADIFRRLIRDPASIMGPPLIEAAQVQMAHLPPSSEHPADSELLIFLTQMESNEVSFVLDAPAPGIAIIHDSYYPGWRASVDGVEVPVLRVNGMARGIPITRAGKVTVTNYYRPAGFVVGSMLAFAAIAILVICSLTSGSTAGRRARYTATVLVAVGCAATLLLYALGTVSRDQLILPSADADPGELFIGFDLRGNDRLASRINIATDTRTLLLTSWGKKFPSALVGPSPLPLITGDIFIDSAGDLNEVDVDGRIVKLRPMEGTSICLLETDKRGSTPWETSTLPLRTIGRLRFATGQWKRVDNEETALQSCNSQQASGRIRFSWLLKG